MRDGIFFAPDGITFTDVVLAMIMYLFGAGTVENYFYEDSDVFEIVF